MKNEEPLNRIAGLFWYGMLMCAGLWALTANWDAIGKPAKPVARYIDPCAGKVIEQTQHGSIVCYAPAQDLGRGIKSNWQPATEPGVRHAE